LSTFSDTLLFFVSGQMQTSHSGDTISISRNLTIASPSTFSVGVNIIFATGVVSPKLNQADNTTNSATATSLTIQAQNATGTTAIGGNLVLTSGTGTSTNGSVNLQIGGTTTASIVPNKFVLNKGYRRNVNLQTTSYNIQVTDDIIAVGVLAGNITLTLPSSPTVGDTYTIKDVFNSAASFTITISGNSNNIDAASTYALAVNTSSITVVFTSNTWSIL